MSASSLGGDNKLCERVWGCGAGEGQWLMPCSLHDEGIRGGRRAGAPHLCPAQNDDGIGAGAGKLAACAAGVMMWGLMTWGVMEWGVMMWGVMMCGVMTSGVMMCGVMECDDVRGVMSGVE